MKKLVLGCLAILISLSPGAWAQALDPGKTMIIELADLIRKNEANRREKIPYHAARMIEVLLYRAKWIEEAIRTSQDYDFESQIRYQAASSTLSYQDRNTLISITQEVTQQGTQLAWKIEDSENPSSGVISLNDLDVSKLSTLEDDIYDQTLRSRGYQTQDLRESPSLKIAASGAKEIQLDIHEKWADRGSFEGSKWEFAPVRIVAWPIQKILYDLPAMVTGTVTESVSRSPRDNAAGAWDELKGAGKLSVNAFKDIGLGVIHPRRARFVDGTLELLDVSFKLSNAVLGIVKTGISVVAYPLYRLFGGKKSQRVALRGKRAVILLVNSSESSTPKKAIVGLAETYGEMMVRSKLKSIADYYCIRTNNEENSIEACIRQMPSNIQYLDVVSLQHSGGMKEAEEVSQMAVQMKGVRPELLLSIGCYDSPSWFVDGENTLGQNRVSFAVNYYLANMLEKRLRGIPADQAANQAFGEGFVTNAINPASWAATIAVGYQGSKPDVITSDVIVQQTLLGFRNLPRTDEWKKTVQEYHSRVEALLQENKIQLKRKTIRLLRESERELAKL